MLLGSIKDKGSAFGLQDLRIRVHCIGFKVPVLRKGFRGKGSMFRSEFCSENGLISRLVGIMPATLNLKP